MAEGCVVVGGMHGREGRGHVWRGKGECVTGEMAAAVDGMHSTGMHSCDL